MTGAWLVVGLGSPGPDYAAHRHTVGHRVIDNLAEQIGVKPKRYKSIAMVAEGRFRPGTDRVILATLMCFMNVSGRHWATGEVLWHRPRPRHRDSRRH